MHTTRAAAIKFLSELITDRMTTPRALSQRLGKGYTYLADYMGEKASPKELPERVRKDLAIILGTDEDNLRFQDTFVKTSVGIPPETGSTAEGHKPAARRERDMSLGDLYVRLGRLEQRVLELEADRPVSAPTERKKRQRPR